MTQYKSKPIRTKFQLFKHENIEQYTRIYPHHTRFQVVQEISKQFKLLNRKEMRELGKRLEIYIAQQQNRVVEPVVPNIPVESLPLTQAEAQALDEIKKEGSDAKVPILPQDITQAIQEATEFLKEQTVIKQDQSTQTDFSIQAFLSDPAFPMSLSEPVPVSQDRLFCPPTLGSIWQLHPMQRQYMKSFYDQSQDWQQFFDVNYTNADSSSISKTATESIPASQSLTSSSVPSQCFDDTLLKLPSLPKIVESLTDTLELPTNASNQHEQCGKIKVHMLLNDSSDVTESDSNGELIESPILNDTTDMDCNIVPVANQQTVESAKTNLSVVAEYDDRANVASFQKSPSGLFDQFLESTLFADFVPQ